MLDKIELGNVLFGKHTVHYLQSHISNSNFYTKYFSSNLVFFSSLFYFKWARSLNAGGRRQIQFSYILLPQ